MNSANTEITEYNINEVRGSHLLHKWLPTLLPVLLCVAGARRLPDWVFMWLLAGAIFAGAKWITLADALPLRSVTSGRLAAYLFLWPGLDLRFCFEPGQPASMKEWRAAIAKTVFGAALVWGAARTLPPTQPLLVGWMGMIGIAFVLHFGLFHLLSAAWRGIGFKAAPLMSNPLGADSVTVFWNGRWNKAFHDLMAPHVFAPLAKRYGGTFALLAVFLVSGLLHEMVISVPARGGFGGPTLYFLAQATGIFMERSRPGRKWGLGHSFRGRLFTILITAGPAACLFHPPFIRNVILPMLRAIGAIGGNL